MVVIYGFEGKFIGKSEYDYCFPEIDDVHKCMLFLNLQRILLAGFATLCLKSLYANRCLPFYINKESYKNGIEIP